VIDTGSAANFPYRFLARTNDDSFAWRQQFIQTFLKGTYHSSVLTFRHPRCFAFGQWSALSCQYLERR